MRIPPKVNTAEDLAKQIAEEKPYLIEIDEFVQSIDKPDKNYAEIDIRLIVRAGVVDKVTFYSGKTWLKDKAKT